MLSLLYGPNLTSIYDYQKTIALTRGTFVSKVMSLLFNMLSRLIIAFSPRSKPLLILWLQSPSVVILETPKLISHCFHCFPIYLPLSDGTGCHDLSFPHVNIIVTVWKRTKQEFANVLFGKSCCIPQVLIFCISVFPSYTCLFSIIEESILNKTR